MPARSETFLTWLYRDEVRTLVAPEEETMDLNWERVDFRERGSGGKTGTGIRSCRRRAYCTHGVSQTHGHTRGVNPHTRREQRGKAV